MSHPEGPYAAREAADRPVQWPPRAASAGPSEPVRRHEVATSLTVQRLQRQVLRQMDTARLSTPHRRASLDAALDGLSQAPPENDGVPRKRQRAEAAADADEVAVLSNLILEANRHAMRPAAVSVDPRLAQVRRLQACFANAAQGGLSALTQPTRLAVMPGQVPQALPVEAEQLAQWLGRLDKPGSYLVLNGNNDEGYVEHLADVISKSQHLRLICSGFGGHGTTGRYPISINRTEGDRFRQILEGKGIHPDRILVDPLSTNSGQNALYVGRILDKEKAMGRSLDRIIVAGTPAAVFRQTRTYAQQLKLSDDHPFEVESFPFSDAARYNQLADHVAVLREFSTTLNYLSNTGFLPRGQGLYPPAFFQAARNSLSTLAQGLREDPAQAGSKELKALDHLTVALAERFPTGDMTTEDAQQAQVADRFMRSMFDALERTFPRSLT